MVDFPFAPRRARPGPASMSDVDQCIADAEAALNAGVRFAAEMGEDQLRRLFLSTRSYLRQQLEARKGGESQ